MAIKQAEVEVKTRTYSTPSRVVRAVEKLNLPLADGKPVRYVISQNSEGRYFPVFVGQLRKPSDEMSEDERPKRGRPAKKVSKTPRKKTRKGTLH